MKFDAVRINQGIDSYNEIMSKINSPEFCTDSFKKLFNGFYRIRQKPSSWYDAYYGVFSDCKQRNLSFKEVLTMVYDKTGELHPSFCSKMIATLNPDKPIWDQYVLQWLGIILNPPKEAKDKIEYMSKIYKQIEIEYNAHLNDKNIQEAIRDFDVKIKNGKNISSIKKIDFMLWSNRNERTVSILDYNSLLDELESLKTKAK